MYKEFFIDKLSGTYSETLEAFGVAQLIDEILSRNDVSNIKIEIINKGNYYLVQPSKIITVEMIEKLPYFQIVKFLKNKVDAQIPEGIGDNYYDYPKQKAASDAIKDAKKKISDDKKLTTEDKKAKFQALVQQYESDFGNKLDEAFDVYKNMIANPYIGFEKIHSNLHNNQKHFHTLLIEILNFYSDTPNCLKKEKRDFKIEEKVTAQQLYSPNQGKGLNKNKADNANMTNLDGHWVQETMKISGALRMMICQYVKVGSGYDLKIFVPEYNHILWVKAKDLMLEFKRHIKSASPVKLDILNVLNFTINFIERSESYTGKVKNTINGFHSVYQKDLGQNKAVANIAFLETPSFVNIDSRTKSKEWLEILRSQRTIINSIKEQGDAMLGLLAYRNFLNGNDLLSFLKFSNWYAGYLMQCLDKKKYVKSFDIEILNIFYINMDTETFKISEIIANEGFLAVASAIRNSTIRLLKPSNFKETHRRFEIRHGLAQELINKSKSQKDFIEFIGDFLAKYDAETAKHIFLAKNPEIRFRPNVKKEEKDSFFALLDKYSPRVIGALLASYGFALEKYEVAAETKLQKLRDEAEKCGYQLVKIEAEQDVQLEGEVEPDDNN